jgi:hypothetical protein
VLLGLEEPPYALGCMSPHRRVASAFLICLGAATLLWCVALGFSRGNSPHADFFDFYWAANAARTGGDLWTSGDGGYIYPPLLALVLAPLTWLGPQVAARVWTVAMAVALLLSLDIAVRVVACACSLRLTSRERLVACSLSFLPLADCVRRELEWSNCNPIVILAWTLSLWWIGQRPRLAGLALSVAAIIKYLPLAMLPMLLLRRRWTEAGWMVLGLTLLALAPALVRGWDRNLIDLSIALGGLARMAGVAAPSRAANIIPVHAEYSHSITSGLARLVRDGAVSPGAMIAVLCCVVCICGVVWILVCARCIRPKLMPWWSAQSPNGVMVPHARVLLAECLFVIALSLALSPQTQKRHLNLLVPVTAVMAVLWVRGSRETRWWMAGACAALVLGATVMPNAPSIREFVESSWKYAGGPGITTLAVTMVVAWRLVVDAEMKKSANDAMS